MQHKPRLLISGDVVMSDFCYEYSYAMLQKLKELLATDRIFVGGNELCKEKGTNYEGNNFTNIADLIISCLTRQLPLNENGHSRPRNVPEVEDLINLAEEFLLIFQEPTKKSKVSSVTEQGKQSSEAEAKTVLPWPITKLINQAPENLQVRLTKGFKLMKVNHVYELVCKSEKDMRQPRVFGKRCTDFVFAFYKAQGIDWEAIQPKMISYLEQLQKTEYRHVPGIINNPNYEQLLELTSPYRSTLIKLESRGLFFDIESFGLTLWNSYKFDDKLINIADGEIEGKIVLLCKNLKSVVDAVIKEDFEIFLKDL